MVGTTRIELVTPAMSTQCSTTELRAHAAQAVSVREALWQVWKTSEATIGDEGLVEPGLTSYRQGVDDSLLPGFSMSGDCDGRWPLLMTSPHSGREFPPAFLGMSRLSIAQLRRAEDALVDELLAGVTQVPVMRARFGRAFLDLNRGAEELDPVMFEGAMSVPAISSERVAAGLGVIPRIAGHGLDIYRRRLPAAEAERRLASLHRPWHMRIGELLARARARHGHAILIDCHSMPTPVGINPPQIVLGDRFGQSAAPALVTMIEQHFLRAGWRVTRNKPYAGGHTTVFHGDVANGIHAVQIEIDRSLYIEGRTLTRHSGFDRVQAIMTALATDVVAAAPAMGLDPALREAAE
jgi:N-formylglutamate amidohydrolase